MSYYYRQLPTTAAGGLITLLDEILVLNANWSIHDAAAAANCKVYKCATVGSVFYLYVDDNQADYAKVRIYEAWDAVTHTGSGTNTSGTDVRWLKIGSTLFILNDTRLIYAMLGATATKNFANYAGQLKRIEDTINSPVLIGSHASTAVGQNPLAHGGTSSTNTIWVICRFDTAVVRFCYCIGMGLTDIDYLYFKADRRWYISENLVFQDVENLVIGRLDGAMGFGTNSTAAGCLHDKKITVDGVRWICWYDGTRGCFMRLD